MSTTRRRQVGSRRPLRMSPRRSEEDAAPATPGNGHTIGVTAGAGAPLGDTHRLAIVAALSARSLSGDDLGSILQQTAEAAAEGVGTESAQILEHRAATDDLLLRAAVGWTAPLVGQVTFPADAASPSGHSLRSGTVLAIEDISKQNSFTLSERQRAQGIAALLAVPIKAEGLAYGVLLVDAGTPQRFGQSEIDFLCALANILAAAILRQRIRVELNRSHRQTAEILESIGAAFYALDRHWRFTYVNRKAEAILDRRRQDLLGKTIWDEFPEMAGNEMHAAHLRAAAERRPVELDTFSGLLGRWIGMTIYPNATGLSVYFRDITERKWAKQALRASEARFRSTFEQAAVGISHVGLDGRWLRVNQRLCEIVGYSADELLRMTFREVTHPDDLEAGRVNRERLLAGDVKTFAMEKRYRRKDGRTLWVRVTVSLMRDEECGGAPRYFICVVEDIDQQKRAETALRESQERLRERDERLHAALLASSTVTYRWDLRSNALHEDETVGQLIGLPPGKTIRHLDEFLAYVHPEDRAAVAEASARSAREGLDFEMDYRVVSPDGTVRWLADKGKVIRDGEGRPSHITGACTDITERKRTEMALCENRERLQRMIDTAVIGIGFGDSNGRILEVNEAFLKLTGYRREELLSGDMDWHRMMPPKDQDRARRRMQTLARTGVSGPVEAELIRKDGSHVPVLMAAAILPGQSDEHVVYVMDLTARKRAEDQQRLLVAELNHRVKNTLSVVLAIASQTLRRAPSPEAFNASFVGRLRALAAAHDLLTQSHWQSADLETVISHALQVHAGGDRALTVHGPALALSPRQTLTLSLVLHELATNAAKYGGLSTSAGRVEIRWELSGGERGPQLRLSWTERDGPAVTRPDVEGFGTKLIERSIAYELGGTVDLAFDPEGLRCTIVMPWSGGVHDEGHKYMPVPPLDVPSAP